MGLPSKSLLFRVLNQTIGKYDFQSSEIWGIRAGSPVPRQPLPDRVGDRRSPPYSTSANFVRDAPQTGHLSGASPRAV